MEPMTWSVFSGIMGNLNIAPSVILAFLGQSTLTICGIGAICPLPGIVLGSPWGIKGASYNSNAKQKLKSINAPFLLSCLPNGACHSDTHNWVIDFPSNLNEGSGTTRSTGIPSRMTSRVGRYRELNNNRIDSRPSIESTRIYLVSQTHFMPSSRNRNLRTLTQTKYKTGHKRNGRWFPRCRTKLFSGIYEYARRGRVGFIGKSYCSKFGMVYVVSEWFFEISFNIQKLYI
jgi:hypothetical protein